ncbi:hypothetical protein LOTGIDRAFT_224000 [Lottia gigantea]|uniref:receptor protein-tyrosine kinase n=1 Tax=Lottia gigantea TaxID=225164 RepID=V4AJA9_LOTGI|nr:hypothetical protein LOTGIDRAFT_224000 [Lottia gigantea]ESP04264.1 hypothetical protein LOTGIDRAFT_224000 [Lottia gigantea]
MEYTIFTLICLLSVVTCLNLKETVPHSDLECHGTSVGLGYSGSRQNHYNNLKKRYMGCTVVHGNLEITNLDDPNIDYDLSFLSDIRYVSGYVFIGLVSELDTLELKSLEVIRGNRTYAIHGEAYSLVVSLTSRYHSPHLGLQQLHLPALKEIVEGRVMFIGNPVLCFINTIPWYKITRLFNSTDNHNPVYYGERAYSTNCDDCPQECSFNGASRCWGPRPQLCSKDIDYGCHSTCNGRCYKGGEDGCCHKLCSVGCTGPTASDCYVCRDFKMEESGECVTHCPDSTYTKSQKCILF